MHAKNIIKFNKLMNVEKLYNRNINKNKAKN